MEDNQLAKVAVWVSTLSGPAAGSALVNTLSRWNTVNSEQALAWLRARPAAERESLLIRTIQTRTMSPSPELVSLAYSISDKQKRDQTLSVLVGSFTGEKEDPEEGIRALGLPASQTEHLLKLRAH